MVAEVLLEVAVGSIIDWMRCISKHLGLFYAAIPSRSLHRNGAEQKGLGIFPLSSLSEVLQCSTMSVKRALRSLEDADLIERRRGRITTEVLSNDSNPTTTVWQWCLC